MIGKLTLVLCVLLLSLPANAQTETILYAFPGGDGNGWGPVSNLTSDGAGNFYGTTVFGGIPSEQGGYGTVYELSPNGSGGWTETALYDFCSVPNCTDGGNPFGPVIFDSKGNLYGTTYGAGAYGYGVVFELSPVGTSWSETVLHSFAGGADGGFPECGLIFDPAGNLYGSTLNYYGLSGTIFELSPSGNGWINQVIFDLGPYSSAALNLAMDATGNIYGVLPGGVFELSPNGNGGWTQTMIYGFTGPQGQKGPPVLDQAGNVYFTTKADGAHTLGAVYKVSPGKQGWTGKILYSFKWGGKDGRYPLAGVAFDSIGNIYGTTSAGGEYKDGTVFELVAPVGKGKYKEKVLWSFNGTDGEDPQDSLILDSAGNLYGTAGIVFEITP